MSFLPFFDDMIELAKYPSMRYVKSSFEFAFPVIAVQQKESDLLRSSTTKIN